MARLQSAGLPTEERGVWSSASRRLLDRLAHDVADALAVQGAEERRLQVAGGRPRRPPALAPAVVAEAAAQVEAKAQLEARPLAVGEEALRGPATASRRSRAV